MTKLLAAALVGTALIAAPLLAKPATKPRPAAANAGWDAKLTRTAAGNHLIGNPAAKVQLVEFISYTCSHCADFARESKGPLTVGPIHGGDLSVEIRPFFRNMVDISATLLVQCGPDSKFVGNHYQMLATQSQWLKAPPVARQEYWKTLAFGPRMKTIAKDLGFYKVMLGRGYSPAQLDACLANEGLANKLTTQTEDAYTRIGVQGTPSFLINGKLQEVYGWAPLKPLLDAALR